MSDKPKKKFSKGAMKNAESDKKHMEKDKDVSDKEGMNKAPTMLGMRKKMYGSKSD